MKYDEFMEWLFNTDVPLKERVDKIVKGLPDKDKVVAMLLLMIENEITHETQKLESMLEDATALLEASK